MEALTEELATATFEGVDFATFRAKGNLDAGIVYNTWSDIWIQDLTRNYKADFEVYGAKAMDRANAEVDIFVGLAK